MSTPADNRPSGNQYEDGKPQNAGNKEFSSIEARDHKKLIKAMEEKLKRYADKIAQYEEKIRQYEEKVNSTITTAGPVVPKDDANRLQRLQNSQLNQDISTIKQSIAQTDSFIEREKADESLVELLNRKARQISILERKLDEYKKRIQEKDGIIEHLRVVLLETEHEASLVQERDRQILHLEESIRDKDRYISELEKTVEESQQTKSDLESSIKSQHGYIASLEWHLDQKDQTINGLNNEISELKRDLAAIKSSTAFRTVRRLGYLFDKVKYKLSISKAPPIPFSSNNARIDEAEKFERGIILQCLKPDLSFPVEVRGNVIIEGWALSALFYMDGVEVFLDERLIGKAEYGIRRSEIARRYPDRPNSATSGFIYNLDVSNYTGQHKLKIVATDKSGSSNFIEGIIIVKPRASVQDIEERAEESRVICTIANKNYLPLARVLTDTFLSNNPTGKVYLLLVDKIDGHFDPLKERFEVILLEDLPIPNLPSFIFKYNITELSTAVKPYFIQYLFEKFNIKRIAYFDPDILITNSLDNLFSLLDNYSIVLTPHILHYYDDSAHPSEVTILQSGTYNLGFVALRDDSNSRKLLNWWQERLYDYCIMDPANGYHVDQKWMDLAPSLFDGVFVLREPGYNVAYWNLNGREVTRKGEQYYVNDKPLYFFHFSGFDPDNIEQVSKHQNRFTLRDVVSVKPLFETYRERVLAAGYIQAKSWPYAYIYFDSGVRIPDIARNMYRSLGNKAKVFGNPFITTMRDSFFNWLISPVDKKTTMPVSRLWYEIYKSRVDLINAFPDPLGANRSAFLEWIVRSGVREHKIDEAFLRAGHVSDNIISTIESKSPLLQIKQASIEYLKKRLIPEPSSPPPSMVDRILFMGINLVGYFNGEFGVAEDVRKFAYAIQAGDIPHAFINVKAQDHRSKDFTFRNFSETNPYPVNIVRINADMTPEFFKSKGTKFYENKYNIGIWAWELPQFPEEWKMSFQYYNELWAISNFIAESLGKISPVPVVKITYPFYLDDTTVVANKAKFGLSSDRYVFLFIFDFLSVFERKNPLAAVKAFEKAFTKSDKVTLVIKTINSKFDQNSLERLKDAIAENQNIKLMDGHLDRAEILNLIASCDCYVSLHRSEGFGITLAEAMYLKKPAIATGWSGNTDFMNINNSYLVKYKIVELDQDYGAYKKGNTWADPDTDHAAELMQYVYSHPEEAKAMGESASNYMKKFFNKDRTAQEIKQRLSSIKELVGIIVSE